jgi:hypothetical protein
MLDHILAFLLGIFLGCIICVPFYLVVVRGSRKSRRPRPAPPAGTGQAQP